MNEASNPPGGVPADAIHLVRTTQQMQSTLSQMADQKASMLLAATSVIFSITLGQAKGDRWPPVPLMILGAFALGAAMCAIFVVLPTVEEKKTHEADQGTNLLFFGTFSKLGQDEFVERFSRILTSDDMIFRAMSIDIYQNGCVLARKKYRMLRHAYHLLVTGLVLSLATFMVDRIV